MFGRREWKTGYGRDIVVVVVDAKKENEKIYNNSQIIFRFVIINIKRESKRVKIIMNNKYSGNVRYVIVLISLIRSLTIQLVLNLFSLSSGVPLYGAVTNGSL